MFPNTTTYERSPQNASRQTESRQLTLFAEDSPARILALRGRGADSLVPALAYGQSIAGLSMKAAPRGSLSRTLAPFELVDWSKCSGKSLRSGMTRNGIVFPLQPLVRPTSATASGLWPTPDASVMNLNESVASVLARRATCKAKWGNNGFGLRLQTAVKMWPTPTANRWGGLQSHGMNAISGSLNPTWVEWLMGFPLEWTALEPSETPSSRKSPKSLAGQSCKPKG